MHINNFKIYNLGPLGTVDIDLGDLTILVGPQASGKSIALETLKLAVDHNSVIGNLNRYNYTLGHNIDNLLNVYYGDGMASIWTDETSVMLDGHGLTKEQISSRNNDDSEAAPVNINDEVLIHVFCLKFSRKDTKKYIR